MRFFIVAVDTKWGIAKDHKIPWHYKEDFNFFKKQTQNSTCIMGYNTYAEIAQMRRFPEKNKELLPGRRNIVITSKETLPEGVERRNSPDISSVLSSPVAFIGGLKIYEYAMGTDIGAVDYGYITRIKHDHDCDLHFNETLLRQNFGLNMIIDETEDLRFERWIRITKRELA
jgi:dihydrofolate reductase